MIEDAAASVLPVQKGGVAILQYSTFAGMTLLLQDSKKPTAPAPSLLVPDKFAVTDKQIKDKDQQSHCTCWQLMVYSF